ncbi:protein SHQ1 homolog [Agrilus planipennis]|uniref:Protein SHQ1 homolog n=1 Tax=Agrilus planipennis TaxID=224129 RepID=A0A1W4WIZ8_AGRPL|nr:protein SHQ1 homolog [Agrilus planipennis]
MITPRFSLKQDENTVTINIRAPYCSLKELDVNVEGDNFLFTCSPYYLRLKLPGILEENDNFHSAFDTDKGEFSFTYDKAIPGEFFPDLDLITKLLEKKVVVNSGERKIEILSSSTSDDNSEDLYKDDLHTGRYGFGLRGGYNFKFVSSEFKDVFEVDPFKTDLQTRRTLRIQEEKQKFSPDHYIADFCENEEIKEFINLKLPCISKTDIQFNDRELDFLKELHNIQYSLTDEEECFCRNGLVDILYGYCYDRRTTYFEGTCESGWTICKLSATLCWFEGFLTLKEAVISAFRRSLIYPLYREFNLSESILKDLKCLFQLGPKQITKCLINMYDIFLGGSCMRYVLNNLYIKDYIIYVMQRDEKFWNNLNDELEKIVIRKCDLGLDLESIERALLCEDNLEEKIKRLTLNSETDETDSDDEVSSETDISTESEPDCTSISEHKEIS